MLKLKNEIQSLKSASQKLVNNNNNTNTCTCTCIGINYRINLEDDIERIKIKRDLQITTINLQTIEVQYTTIEKVCHCVCVLCVCVCVYRVSLLISI